MLNHISLAATFVYFYRENKMNFDKDYWISLFETELNILKNVIKKLKPLAEAVILRRFVKKIMEKFITKNIDLIEIEDYSPELKVLESYHKSLKDNYIFGRFDEINIESNIASLIKDLTSKPKEKEFSNEEEKGKEVPQTIKRPKLIYLDKTGRIDKIMNILFKLKNQCNQIIHFGNKFEHNLIIHEYILGNSFLNEEQKSKPFIPDNQNKIINVRPNVDNKKLISISKIVKFITDGNSSNISLEKLRKLKEEMNQRIKLIKEITTSINKYQISEYVTDKQHLQYLKQKIEADLSSLAIQEYNPILSEEKIRILATHFDKNPININDTILSEENRYEGIENNLAYFNGLKRGMNIKNKIKFNMSFSYNLLLINYKKKIDVLLNDFDKIGTINKEIENLNNYFKDELNKIIQESKDSDSIIKLINREELFIDMGKEEFISIFENEFKDEFIDIFNDEINNSFLFIYLHKKGLYDEKSYKSAADIN